MATAQAPSRYAVHRSVLTTADDNETGRSPGAQPRGPRPGFAADGRAKATSSSRANERVNAGARSHPSDLSQPGNLMTASGSDTPKESADNAVTAHSQRTPDVAKLLGAVDLASPARAGNPMLKLARDLKHPQTGADNVDGESDLNSPARRQR